MATVVVVKGRGSQIGHNGEHRRNGDNQFKGQYIMKCTIAVFYAKATGLVTRQAECHYNNKKRATQEQEAAKKVRKVVSGGGTYR
jgi:hypothetical protein